jgi:hypothetical protein
VFVENCGIARGVFQRIDDTKLMTRLRFGSKSRKILKN